jgi:hypothetical protein
MALEPVGMVEVLAEVVGEVYPGLGSLVIRGRWRGISILV